MKDDFKEYTNKYRDQFDVESPDELIWQNISVEFKNSQKQKYSRINFWKVAASILLMTTIGLTFLIWKNSRENNDLSQSKITQLAPEFVVIEKKYQRSIDELSSEINLESISTDHKLGWLRNELDTMDSVNAELLKEHLTERNKERLIQIMIDHYEKKLKLLKRIEHEIKRIKNEKGNEIIS